MQRRYITVDVFTARPFGGNPLAVVLDAGGLSTAQMQAIAAEFNYSAATSERQPTTAMQHCGSTCTPEKCHLKSMSVRVILAKKYKP
jgi:Phenazine biosynthesis-like protein